MHDHGHQIVTITREEFMAKAPFSKEDAFCAAYHSKCDMQEMWGETFGILVDGELAACITTTQSKREPKVANLQLLHTFAKFRGRGLARVLCTWALRREWERGSQYLRVSAEPDAVAFYEKIGYKFLGRQKSGCQLSMFRMTGPTIHDAIYDRADPVIASAISSKRKGGVVEDFEKPSLSIAKEDTTGLPSTPPKMTPLEEPAVARGAVGFHLEVRFDEAMLRRVIREELQAILGTAGTTGVKPARAPEPAPAPPPPPAVGTPPAGAPPATKPPREKKAKPPRPAPVDFLNPERVARLEKLQEELAAHPEDGSPRVVNIRGTSGSGKTHVVRTFLDEAREAGMLQTIAGEDGKRPLGYIIKQPSGKRDIFVVGQYETSCGGADSISGQGALDTIYDLVERQVTEEDNHVLFEGLIVCSDFRRTRDLVSKKFPIEVILLDTSLEQCCKNIDARRATAGKPPLEHHNNTVQKHAGNLASVPRFQAEKVPILQMSVEDTIRYLRGRFS